jgi:hypothetical protein
MSFSKSALEYAIFFKNGLNRNIYDLSKKCEKRGLTVQTDDIISSHWMSL